MRMKFAIRDLFCKFRSNCVILSLVQTHSNELL